MTDRSTQSETEIEERDERRGRVVAVRPKGYVEPHVVARRVGACDLFLGNRHAAARADFSFDFVLSVSSERYPLTTHHRPLTDGPGNDWRAFEAAVDTARELHQRDGVLLVHCEAGISRSAAVIATALAAQEELSFRAALDAVQAVRPAAMPHPALHELGVCYLAANG